MVELARSPEQLGNAIRRARKKAGMSQSDLGYKTGLRQETISLLENGNPAAKLETILAVLSALNLEFQVHPRVSQGLVSSPPASAELLDLSNFGLSSSALNDAKNFAERHIDTLNAARDALSRFQTLDNAIARQDLINMSHSARSIADKALDNLNPSFLKSMIDTINTGNSAKSIARELENLNPRLRRTDKDEPK